MKKIFCSIFLILFTVSPNAFSGSFVEIEDITVIANRTPQARNRIPNTVDVLNGSDMAFHKKNSLGEILQQISGLNVGEKSLAGEDLDIRMRGSDRDEVLVLFDGVPIEGNGEARAFFLNLLPPEFIEKIEIIKGAQSVLYGSNAVGGVINIVSKKARPETKENFARFSYRTDTSFREAFGGQFGSKKSSLYLGAVREDARVLNRFNDQSGTTGLHLAFTRQLTDNISLNWGLDGFYARQNISYDQINTFTAAATLNSYVVPDDDIKRKIGWVQSRLQLEGEWADRFTTRLQIAGNHLDEILTNTNVGDAPVDETGAPLTPGSQYYSANSYRIFSDLFNQYRLVDADQIKNDLQLGFTLIHDHLDFINNSFSGDVGAGLPSTDAYPGVGEESGRENYAVYFQNLFDWDDLTVTAGARLDHNTTFGNEWSPRVGAAYTIDKTGTTFRASYSEGFHAPTIAEFFDATVGGTVTALAMKQAQETSRSYEGGIEQSLFDGDLKLRSTFFYIHYDQLLDIVEAIDGGANSWGLENDVFTTLIPRTKVGANYTFNRTHNGDTGGELTLRPHHMANVYVEVEPFTGFTVRPQMAYVSKRKNPETISLTIGEFPVNAFNSSGQTGQFVAGHTVFDLLLNYKWEKPFAAVPSVGAVDFFANVRNLLNERYENNFGYPAPGFSVTLGSQCAF